jgi:hypothetical protein
MHGSPITLTTTSSAPIMAGQQTLVVHARVFQLRLPFAHLVWNRPTAVSVRGRGLDARTLPIRDVTRLAQMVWLALPLAAMLIVLAARRRQSQLVHTEVNA